MAYKELETYGNPKLPLSYVFKESLINFMKYTFEL